MSGKSVCTKMFSEIKFISLSQGKSSVARMSSLGPKQLDVQLIQPLLVSMPHPSLLGRFFCVWGYAGYSIFIIFFLLSEQLWEIGIIIPI